MQIYDRKPKVAYIHARPHGHPIHEAYANSLQPDRYFIDFILRWHDKQRLAIVRYMSWIFCALFFPNKKKYDVFYADGPVHFLAIMKFLGLIGKNQKLIFLLADETLYFIQNKLYGKIAERVLRWVIGKADGYVCVGEQQMKLLEIVLQSTPKAVKIINGIDDQRCEGLKAFKPHLSAKNIVYIANIGDSEVRRKYKGIDMLPLIIHFLQDSDINIMVVGNVSERIKKELLSNLPQPSRLVFVGETPDLNSVLESCFVCIHPAVGEAWGISVSECMLAGLPVLVSNLTGAKELLYKHQDFILQNDPKIFALKIHEILQLSREEKKQLSDEMKNAVSILTFSHSIMLFEEAFRRLLFHMK